MPHSHDEIPIDGELGDPLGLTFIHTSREPAERTVQLREDLASGPFEFAVRERVVRLAAFRHPAFVTVNRVERLRQPSRLLIVGDVPAGSRLLDVLRQTSAPPAPWSIAVVKGLLESVATFHDVGPDVAHGLITPERIFVDESGRVALTDYVFALAVQQLRYSTDRYATELHLPLPSNCVLFDQRLDLFQIGTLATRLLFGEGSAPDPVAAEGLRTWISRLTGSRAPWRSAREALEALPSLAGIDEFTPAPMWAFEHADVRVAPEGEHDATTRVSISTFQDLDAEYQDETAESATSFETALPWPERPGTEPAAAEISTSEVQALAQAVSWKQNGNPSAEMIADRPASPRRLPTTLAVFAVLIVAALVGRARSGPLTAGRLPSAAAASLGLNGSGVSKAQGSQRAATDAGAGAGPAAGTLNIRTEPAGIAVSVDGRAVGATPITVELAPGEHRVTLPGAAVEQTVAVRPQATTMLVIPLAAKMQTPATRAGWLELRGPIDAQVFENGQLIATTDSPRVRLAPGLHHVEVVNAAVGFREAHTVDVKPAAVSTLSFEVPEGSMAVNAVPWADVSLDGESLGPTPIGNILVSVGSHEVVFRHPAYGEQRRTVTVPVKGIARLSVDFTKGAP